MQGPPASGKSALAHFLTSTTILPLTWDVEIGGKVLQVEVGGKDQGVVWFDCDGRFEVSRVADFVRTHLSIVLGAKVSEAFNVTTKLEEECAQLVEGKLRLIMKVLRVFKPDSLLRLSATLHSLPEFLKEGQLFDDMKEDGDNDDTEALRLSTKELSLLILEGLYTLLPSSPSSSSLRQLLSSLSHARTLLSPIIIITQPILNPTKTTYKSQENYPFFDCPIKGAWPSILAPLLPGSSALTGPGGREEDGLRVVRLPNSDTPTIELDYSISTFPSPSGIVSAPCRSLSEALQQQSVAKKRREVEGEEEEKSEFVAILRARAGKELGDWAFSVGQGALHG